MNDGDLDDGDSRRTYFGLCRFVKQRRGGELVEKLLVDAFVFMISGERTSRR